jgi:hypothetical protein
LKGLHEAIETVGSEQGEERYKELLFSWADDEQLNAYAYALMARVMPTDKFTSRQTEKILNVIRYAAAVGICIGMEMERK